MGIAVAWFVAGVAVATLVGRHLPPGDGSAAHAAKTAASLLAAVAMVGVLAAVPLALVVVVASAFADGVTGWIDRNPTLAGLVVVVVVGVATDLVIGAATRRRR
jgi:hypothetical protein